jgi:hypothetical protein
MVRLWRGCLLDAIADRLRLDLRLITAGTPALLVLCIAHCPRAIAVAEPQSQR